MDRGQKNTEIGEVDSGNGNSLTIRLDDNIKSNMPIIDGFVYRVGQIGSFLKVQLGYSNVYGIVTQIGAAAIPEKIQELSRDDYSLIKNTRWVTLVLIGEQTGSRFERGITQHPTPGDRVHLVTISDLNLIYGKYDASSSISIGTVSASESLTARIDLDKLISRHCAILGSTGSGKSNAVSVLLEAIADANFNSSRVILIDPHGEYAETLTSKSKVFKIGSVNEDSQLHIPYWALPFDELLSMFPGSLSDPNREYIREKVLEHKRNALTENNINIVEDFITADSPVPFSIKKLWFELDDFERQTFAVSRTPTSITPKTVEGNAEVLRSNNYPAASAGGGAPFLNHNAKTILRFLDGMKTKLKDSRFDFLFSPGPYKPNTTTSKIEKDLPHLMREWLANDKPITILDLSGVPSEIMASISGAVLKVIYDFALWGQNTLAGGKKQPILIVLEEAHSYLKAGEESMASRTVQTIAKEGRKYGVGLALVTQRPSELDETVLSQCGSLIALRMNNQKDRTHISSAVQDELQSLIDLLPSLRTGEAIISGEAVRIPSRIQFHRIARANKGSDPKASIEWRNQKPPLPAYESAIDHWRRQTFNKREED